MSDEEKGRHMMVTVNYDRQMLDKLKEKAEFHDELMKSTIENLNAKWQTDDFDGLESMSELMNLDKENERLEQESKRNRKPPSKGSVMLGRQSPLEDILSREYDNAEELVKDLYEEWKTEENAERRIQLRAYINKLLKKKDRDDDAFHNIRWTFDRVPTGLSPKHTWREFTTHAQEKHKANLERQRK